MTGFDMNGFNPELFKLWQQLSLELFSHPQELWMFQGEYVQALLKLYQSVPNFSHTPDKRFAAPAWQENPWFAFLKEIYLLNANYLRKIIALSANLSPEDARKLRFYAEQWINLCSPANYFFSNPEILQDTLKSRGENIQRGMENFLKDFQRSKNHHDIFSIQMTDQNAFEVGKNLATTPGKIIYRNDLIELIQYAPRTPDVYQTPLLIIPPWINKYYILDLQPHNSFVKYAVDQGHTVFLISWINPDARHRDKDLTSYMTEGVLAAIENMQKITGEKKINTLGFCIGGTLLAATVAYLAAKKQDDMIASATYLATLLDFTDAGDISVFIDEKQIAALEKIMAKTGYLDGGYMATAFNLLRSNDLVWSYYVNNYLAGKKPAAFDILYWNTDSTNLPYKMHSEYLRQMYLNNKLREPRGISLNHTPIDLRKITTPTCCIGAEQDHIAPWRSVFTGMQLLAGSVKFMLGESGHIAGIINPPPAKKYGYRTSTSPISAGIEAWLDHATVHHDSWWPEWQSWLANYSGRRVPARKPDEKSALGDAPGTYVLTRL